MAGGARRRAAHGRARARRGADRRPARPRRRARRPARGRPQHAVRQHDPGRPRGAAPRRPRARAPHPRDHPLERDRARAQRQQGVVGARRPHRLLPVGRDALRGRLQPLLARADGPTTRATSSTCRATRRPASTRACSSRAASPRSSCAASARRSPARTASSSYPHPWLMPDVWQFPTVTMGLGPLMAIYQARFMKYLQGRNLAETAGRKVWAFMGDGEMDEPESLGCDLARRPRAPRQPDLRRQLQPAAPRRARCAATARSSRSWSPTSAASGWNVIKVVWGDRWDPLLAGRRQGPAACSGWRRPSTASTRPTSRATAPTCASTSSGSRPELLQDGRAPLRRAGLAAQPRRPRRAEGLRRRTRRGQAAKGKPTVILAKTIKGYGMGASGEGQNITHQAKKMDEKALLTFRDRFELELTDEQVARRRRSSSRPTTRREIDLPARAPRGARRRAAAAPRRQPSRSRSPTCRSSRASSTGTGDREISTTMAFVRMLAALLRDKQLGPRIVPIVPDESRTFGMEGMFRQLGIFSQVGQLYQPQDRDQLMYYREDKRGQILQEGINEPGAFSSWLAAATSYANHGLAMVPFYIYYSMFGFQRVGDLAWAAGDIAGARLPARRHGRPHDAQRRGPPARGRPQPHPGVADPQLRRLRPDLQLRARGDRPGRPAAHVRRAARTSSTTSRVMNENYVHPAMPEGAEEGILRGLYPLRDGGRRAKVQLMGSGTILREVIAGADLLREDFGIEADVWSATSFTELRRDGHGAASAPPGCAATADDAVGARSCLDGPRGPDRRRRRTTSARSRTDPPVRATARWSRWAPTASAARTGARALRSLLRGRPPPRRRSPRCARSARTRPPRRRSSSTRSTRRLEAPWRR